MSGRLRLSCFEEMLGEVPLATRFARAQAAGFQGIDLRGDHLPAAEDEARDLIDSTGLAVPAVYGRLPGPLLAGTARERADAVQVLEYRLAGAARLGATRLILVPVFGPPRISLADPEPLELAELEILLAELAERAEESQVELVLEPLNAGETHLVRSPTRGAELARRVGSPWVGTMLDTYHADQEGQDMIAEIAAAGDRLRLVHLSDRGRTLPGRGETGDGIDFAAVLRALAEGGYAGYHGFECRVPFDAERLERSVAWIRDLA